MYNFTVLCSLTLFIILCLSHYLHLSLSNPHSSLPEEDDWNVVIIECSSLAAKWEQLSGYLGLSIRLIDNIKGNHPNNNSACWNDALKHWILQNYKTEKFGSPSWRTLLRAVAEVDKLLFRVLAPKHQGICTLYCTYKHIKIVHNACSCG